MRPFLFLSFDRQHYYKLKEMSHLRMAYWGNEP